jgi:hypothetical protein
MKFLIMQESPNKSSYQIRNPLINYLSRCQDTPDVSIRPKRKIHFAKEGLELLIPLLITFQVYGLTLNFMVKSEVGCFYCIETCFDSGW